LGVNDRVQENVFVTYFESFFAEIVFASIKRGFKADNIAIIINITAVINIKMELLINYAIIVK